MCSAPVKSLSISVKELAAPSQWLRRLLLYGFPFPRFHNARQSLQHLFYVGLEGSLQKSRRFNTLGQGYLICLCLFGYRFAYAPKAVVISLYSDSMFCAPCRYSHAAVSALADHLHPFAEPPRLVIFLYIHWSHSSSVSRYLKVS